MFCLLYLYFVQHILLSVFLSYFFVIINLIKLQLYLILFCLILPASFFLHPVISFLSPGFLSFRQFLSLYFAMSVRGKLSPPCQGFREPLVLLDVSITLSYDTKVSASSSTHPC